MKNTKTILNSSDFEEFKTNRKFDEPVTNSKKDEKVLEHEHPMA